MDCLTLAEIHERYGSPNISFLPISVGAVLPYIEKITRGWVRVSPSVAQRFHATPDDALCMLENLGGLAYGIHWGTWSTDEGASRTVSDLEAAKTAHPRADKDFRLSKIGEWIYVE